MTPELAELVLVLGKGLLKITLYGKLFLKDESDKEVKKKMPTVDEVVEFLNIPTRERTKEKIKYIASYLSETKFFKSLEQDSGKEITEQCAKEMKAQLNKSEDHIITFGDFGRTFYVVLKGQVAVYIPASTKLHVNQKEFLEFVVPIKRYVKSVNKEPLELPNYIDILKFDSEGKIDMDALHDFFSQTYKSAQYNRAFVLRNIGNRNKNDYEIEYFTKVATLGDGFDFGGDALVGNTARNATIACETDIILATLDKHPFDMILRKHKKKKEDFEISRVSNFSVFKPYSK